MLSTQLHLLGLFFDFKTQKKKFFKFKKEVNNVYIKLLVSIIIHQKVLTILTIKYIK